MHVLEIKPVNNSAFDCFDSSVISSCNWFKHEFQIMFAKAWNFSYDNISNNINSYGDRLDYDDYSWISLLKRYHGVELKFISQENVQYTQESIMKEIINKRPVIICLDSYWCPWSPDYKNQDKRGPHFFLIVGYDQQTYYCIDGLYLNTIVQLTFEDFINGYKDTYITFNIRKLDLSIDYDEIVNLSISKMKNKKAIEEMHRFAFDIKNRFDINTEGSHYIINSPLIQKLESLGRGRLKYGIFLHYLAEKSKKDYLGAIGNEFSIIGNKWATLQRMFIKIWFSDPSSHKVIIDRIANEIQLIASLEEKMLNAILGT